ncbi:DUF2812 domain-containing protein [Ureibacillus chungkukjangi]|uniref:Uncharacterized protein DUF2812 n=1 Tax=Ureibacillus chungkukjangi TaxID=1202712 RepID=A0A318U632_9BACL|nr:DUF2812 domain-containing protein [Ureibacillus chungkukjangi]MCM3387915.1 DUF2812 domain-containing protein [Ureibacillus chungkukjangi]PYF07399.1 uncharacterized protein DUF2812 [Ureibacillus chungkukjangi]
MKKTKYIMSWGLAFAEKQDLEKLSKKAKQGWRLKSLAFAGFRLEKGAPEHVQYSVDYRLLKEGEKEEYLELFSQAGWEHVCSSYDIHIFKAPYGTTPIYSDTESAVDKLDRLLKPVSLIGKFILPLTMISYLLMNFLTGPIEQFSKIIFLISMVFAVPTLMMVVALMLRKKKLTITKSY